jgi:hypothetical protein
MARRALLIGINHYEHVSSLTGCVKDAEALAEVLRRNDDGSPNFDCRVYTSPGTESITRAFLREKWQELFANFRGDILFYFSGHGAPLQSGGYLVTQDAVENDPGLPMNELVTLANSSQAGSVTLILDCCYAGWAGNRVGTAGATENSAELREGVTILASSLPGETSDEVLGGHGVFTELIIGALKGGAADIRGRISAASVYAYAEAALGAWDQRPLYKSYAKCLEPLRLCKPKVDDALLREIAGLFPTPDHSYQMDPTFEETNHGVAREENVAIFKKFKRLQIAGLLDTKAESHSDLYWTAERSGWVILTPLGQFYWRLSRNGRI